MVGSLPGIRAVKETEEVQIWASGPDNNHKRFHTKAHIKSTVTDSGNTNNTTTLRGGNLIARKDSDSLDYLYSAAANDGTQGVIGLLEKHLPMFDRDGVAEDKIVGILNQGIIRSTADLVGVDKAALAVLLRMGFTLATAKPNGSAFLLQPVRRDFFTADYTIVDTDHGKMLVAATNAVNFTLPVLATVGPGFEVLLFQSANQNMVVTAAVDTIIYDDTTNGKATTLTFSTASQKMGASVLMRSDFDAGGTLSWYPLMIQRTVVAA
jgi:hypothetical protein